MVPEGYHRPPLGGTNAAQTAVVWNGLNINSQLTGQTDFNTISTYNYDHIAVRSGGGSVPYGTGAVGGSIHLNNDISFNNTFKTQVLAGYGSYTTPIAHIKSSYSTEAFFIGGGIDYIQSDNDFDYLDTQLTNENGDYDNINWNLNAGWLVGKQHTFKVYHNTFLGDRGFSRTLTAVSNSAYEDRQVRNLVQWDMQSSRFKSQLRLAHLFEQFRFFLSRDFRENFSIGKASRYTANYQAKYHFNTHTFLQAIIDYTTVEGDGSSIIQTTRNTFNGTLQWNQQLDEKWQYSVQLRQDATTDFDSPLLLGLGSSYAFAKAYTLKLNASRNYRIPTFNDLFWSGPGAQGNPDIIPETSWQGELGHELRLKNLNINIQNYYIRAQNLIVWRPNVDGIFTPINVSDTEHYGAEIGIDYTSSLGKHRFMVSGKYGYTMAQDMVTANTLPYVPRHKIIGALSYSQKQLSAYYQWLYNDEVFTTTDNTTTVAGYGISNAGISYTLRQKQERQLTFSLRAQNIFNKNYQTIAFRPNPGRNFLIQTSYTF